MDLIIKALVNGFDNKIVESLPEKQKERFGFYYFIISQLTGVNDYDEITELISDTDFNKTFYGNKDPDEGVDAIYIDEDNNVIHIFNFKYRKDFNPDRKQGENEAILTFKFLSAIKGDASLPNKKLKELVDAIKERYESNDIWETIFHIVSNENHTICPKDPNIKNFAEIYDVKINPIGLNEITEFMSLRPSAVNAELMLNKESVMSFNSDDLSTNKSFVASISLPELIRITCNNEELRYKYNIEDENELHSFNINYNVLFDNVRGFVIRSKFNKNIESTIQSAPHKFFYFNNGITIVADNIS